jgi:hypothetical protein
MSNALRQRILDMAKRRANGVPLLRFYSDSVPGEFQRARLRHDLLKTLNVSLERADALVRELVR